MKKKRSTRPYLEQERRIGLPGLFSRKMQKNCSTRPSLNQKRRRIAIQDRPVVAQSSNNEIPHGNRALWETFFPGLNFNKNCKGTVLQLLQTKNEEELLYQASSKMKMKKNCSTRLPLEEK